MVQLQQHTDAVAAQAGQEPEFPERTPAVQQLSVQPGGGVQELKFAPWRFNGGLANVILNVELMVVDPQRLTTQRTRKVKTSSQLRNVCQTAIHALPDISQRQLPAVSSNGVPSTRARPPTWPGQAGFSRRRNMRSREVRRATAIVRR
jgi:hypothetical protein